MKIFLRFVQCILNIHSAYNQLKWSIHGNREKQFQKYNFARAAGFRKGSESISVSQEKLIEFQHSFYFIQLEFFNHFSMTFFPRHVPPEKKYCSLLASGEGGGTRFQSECSRCNGFPENHVKVMSRREEKKIQMRIFCKLECIVLTSHPLISRNL